MNKIIILVVNGVGGRDQRFMNESSPETFLGGIKRKINDKIFLLTKGNNSPELIFKPIYWQEITQPSQDIFKQVVNTSRLANPFGLRDFIINSISDSIAYQRSLTNESVYGNIHNEIDRLLTELSLQGYGDSPVCVIGYSFGSVIGHDYFWNLQHQEKTHGSPLQRGETLSLFCSLGSPIALWNLQYQNPLFGIPVKTHKWLNFYAKNDVLSYPLSPLGDAYNFVEDIRVTPGNFFTRWNPLSHLSYWGNATVIDRISRELIRMCDKSKSHLT
jgi:hypothetical protein